MLGFVNAKKSIIGETHDRTENAKINTMGNVATPSVGGENAITAIQKYSNVSTQYLQDNKGYAKKIL